MNEQQSVSGKAGKDLSARLDELESRMTFQDDLISALNDIVTRQDREMAILTVQVRGLVTRLSEMADTAAPGTSGEYENPPHY